MVESISQEQNKSALVFTWGKYRVYAATARKRKYELSTWRFRVLSFAITGAVLATASQQIHNLTLGDEWTWVSTILGLFSALALGLAVYLGREMVNPDQERQWIRARSMAEALKSQVYRFLTGVSPYDKVAEKGKRLLAESNELLSTVEDMSTDNVSEEKQQKQLAYSSLTVEDYIKERVNDQIEGYYRPQSRALSRKMRRNKNVGLGLGVLAIILGVLGFTGWTAGWVATISTVAASITTYAFAGRYQYLIVSYQATANRLESLRTGWEVSGKSERDAKQFILNCEQAISIENNAWMAELVKEKKE